MDNCTAYKFCYVILALLEVSMIVMAGYALATWGVGWSVIYGSLVIGLALIASKFEEEYKKLEEENAI